jgi:pterin-4a-carbinolamine dehydratase
MSSVVDIMREYFDDENNTVASITETKLPVKPSETKWEYVKVPNVRLTATFTFKKNSSYAFFISEIADLEEKMGQHGELLCKYPDITIIIRTDELDTVTKHDLLYAKEVLSVFRDAKKIEDPA